MNVLKLQLNNCFGIKSLDSRVVFGQSQTALIYAPNGTMKSSLALTLDKYSKNELIQDRVNPKNLSQYDIRADIKNFKKENIVVIKGDDVLDASSYIPTFLASKNLNKKYKKITEELDKSLKNMMAKIKKSSGSSNCDKEILQTFANSNDNDILTCLESIYNNEYTARDYSKIPDFKYNKVFDPKVKDFLSKHNNLIENYIKNYNELLSRSTFFNKNNEGKTFGTVQANALEKSLADDSFFGADHVLKLRDGSLINSFERFKLILNGEIKKILEDDELQKNFQLIDNALSKNAALKDFKELLEHNHLIIPYLANYEDFRKVYWYKQLSLINEEFTFFVELYNTTKNQIQEILEAAKNENERWEQIIEIFNIRFTVPFTIHLANKEDIIVKENKAELEFKYDDNSSSHSQTREDLLNVLSTGEKRAFFLLQFLFAIESRKDMTDIQLIVFDDIADSFDYKNKFAIIEYMQELAKLSNFRLLILTHNFDFYRTIALRFGLKGNNIYMSQRLQNGEIELLKGLYVHSISDYFTKEADFSVAKFLAYLPFIRNIIEYTKGNIDNDYKALTYSLHYKTQTETIKLKDLAAIALNHISHLGHIVNHDISNSDVTYYSCLMNEANTFCNAKHEDILLEKKIILAIAIRLLGEKYLIEKLKQSGHSIDFSHNQYRDLFDKYRSVVSSDKNTLRILNRIALMTPENLHVNSFMFEPLVDMSSNHLCTLYNETKALT